MRQWEQLRNWSRTNSLRVLAVATFAILAASVARSGAADPPDDEIKAQILGSLLCTRVDVRLQDVPTHEALMLLSGAVGWSVLDYWADEDLGEPDRPDIPINIEARDVSADLVLEMIIAQAAVSEPLTWQIGAGVIEVGTKSRLSVRGSREQRLYDVDALLASKPYFQGPELAPGGLLRRRELPDTNAFNNHSHRAAALYDGYMDATYRGLAGQIRQDREAVQRAVLRGFVDLVEPGNWDFGDQLRDVLPGDRRYKTHTKAENEHCIAQVREVKAGWIAVAAPDFIHRALGGYPIPIDPRTEPASTAERNVPADTKNGYIRLVRVDIEERDRVNRGGFPDAVEAPEVTASHVPARGGVLLSHLSSTDEARHLLARVIEERIVPVEFVATPAREAFTRLSRDSGVPIIARFTDDGVPGGMPADAPVTFSSDHLSVRRVIELMVSQCNQASQDCTWQIRPGFVEVGTKDSLSVDAARDLRVYNTCDLVGRAHNMNPNGDDDEHGRKPPQVFALDFVETLVGTIEPEVWDWGQDLDDEETAFLEGRNKNLRPAEADPVAPAVTSNVPMGAGRQYVPHLKPAIIRYWEDVIIIVAPDYIHRQIGGYGELSE